jgi:hypothetical protein
MDTPVKMPFLERRRDNLHIVKGPYLNHASTTFLARSFVKLSSGVLVPVATADVVCVGWTPSASHTYTGSPSGTWPNITGLTVTDRPPVSLYEPVHWPFDPKDSQFIMNITDASGHIGESNGAPTLAEAVIGSEFGIYRDGTSGKQMLNVDDTSTKFARVVGWVANQASTDYNGLVIVELLAAVITG